MKILQGSGPSGTPEYREDGVSLSRSARLGVEVVLRVLDALDMPLLLFPYVPHVIPEKRHAKCICYACQREKQLLHKLEGLCCPSGHTAAVTSQLLLFNSLGHCVG